MGKSGSFKIVRTTASYFFSPSGHGKWTKTVFFRIFANYSENVVVCYSIIFLTRVMAAQSQWSLVNVLDFVFMYLSLCICTIKKLRSESV